MTHPLETAPLQPVLRLIHCMQKERGASCALVGSLAQPDAGHTGLSGDYSYESALRVARVASNSAIISFYGSTIWRLYCAGEGADFEVTAMLFRARQLVDSGAGDANKYLFFHDVFVEYSSLLTSMIKVFVVNEVASRKKDLQKSIHSPSVLNESTSNAENLLSLLDLILSFVTLKENLGMERAMLSGLMVYGITEVDQDEENNDVEAEVQASNHGKRLNLIVNDLVMVVESQHRIMRNLRKRSGRKRSESGTIFTDYEDPPEVNHTLLRLVGESITPSDAMRSLQEHVREDFDIVGFQQAMTMEEFWAGITLYMDRLHSMELFLLEELENCEGNFEDLDILALGKDQFSRSVSQNAPEESKAQSFDGTAPRSTIEAVAKMSREELKDAYISLLTQKESKLPPPTSPTRTNAKEPSQSNNPPPSSPVRIKDNDKPALAEWEISLYDVEFHKRIGRGSAGTTYLGKYCQQDVAVKVASTSEIGLGGWTAELTSLQKLRHTNIIRFLGAIYNQSPLTYCLVLEYCDGGDLSVALDGSTPPKFFTHVASGVANGLYYLHKMKYMHRDIKPSNVLLSGDPKSGRFVAKLTDFGLAAQLQNASVTNGGKELTAETGTYRYMAPEVIRHERYDYTADVYSFALLMWEIITREKPFEPKSQIEAAGAVALEGKRPPFPDGTPLAVRSLIEKCWAEKPNERMEVERIIACLDELGSNALAEPWLAAPAGHPVYNPVAQDEPLHALPAASMKIQPRMGSLLKSGSFFWKKK